MTDEEQKYYNSQLRIIDRLGDLSYRMFKEFIERGFTKTEAIELTKVYLGGMME